MTWPNESDFGQWDEDIYISEDPDKLTIEPVFGWSRIAVRKVDDVIEKVTEWRFTIEPPSPEVAQRTEIGVVVEGNDFDNQWEGQR